MRFWGGVRIGHPWGGCMLQETGDALAVVRFPWDETGDALAGPRSVWRGGTGTTAGENSPCLGCLRLDRVSTGIIFSLLASYGLIWAFSRCWESFVPVELMYAVCGESFVPVAALHAACPESFVPVSVRCVASVWWPAGKSSPCSGSLRPDRDNFLPARVTWADLGVFCGAGRVLYRLSSCTPCAGRVLYRLWLCIPCARRVLYR